MKGTLTFVTALAFVALFAMPAQAQEKARFGLQGGVTSSSFSGADVPSSGESSKTGFFAGAFFNYFVAANWSVSVEGNWLAGVGSRFTSEGFESETKMSYIEVPLSLNFAFPLGESEKTWLGLSTGITGMLNLTCKETSNVSGSTEEDCKDSAESFIWAIPFGAGIGFKASDSAVVWLGARYQLGLSDAFEDFNAKLNIWEFVLGVGFPTG